MVYLTPEYASLDTEFLARVQTSVGERLDFVCENIHACDYSNNNKIIISLTAVKQ